MLVLAVTCLAATAALTWDATGHEWVSGIAAEKLPDSLPSFIRSPEVIAEIAVMGRELHRSKWAIRGRPRDPLTSSLPRCLEEVVDGGCHVERPCHCRDVAGAFQHDELTLRDQRSDVAHRLNVNEEVLFPMQQQSGKT